MVREAIEFCAKRGLVSQEAKQLTDPSLEQEPPKKRFRKWDRKPHALADWLYDPKLQGVINHETRSHIVLDEYADLTSDPDAKKEIENLLKRLAQKARAAGIHVIIATQNPRAEVISTNLRSNLPAQLALKVKSGTESRVIMDEAGAESLNGKGDAFLKSEGRLTRVQCAKV